MSLYLQANLLLVLGWLLFRLLPKRNLAFRSQKKLARVVLISAIVMAPAIRLIPEAALPKPKIKILAGQESDGFALIRSGPETKLPSETSRSEAGAESPFDLVAWCERIFLSGLLLMLILRWRESWLLRKFLLDTMTLHRMGRVIVAVTDAAAVPFSAISRGHAWVVLPAELISYRPDLKIALHHEIEHHRQRDAHWSLALEWLAGAFYLNPAIYLWRKTITQLQELACDETLIRQMGISEQEYGNCLLRVAEMVLNQRFMRAGTTCMIPADEPNGHSFLRRRMQMFVFHKKAKSGKAAAYSLGTLACVSLAAMAYLSHAAVKKDKPTGTVTAVFDSRIQPLTERILKRGMAQHQATAGFAIVADAVSGMVISAVSINDGFDKNLKGDWALSYPLQPGSVLKPLIAASALQRKVTRIDEMHNCENGKYALGKNLYNDVEAYEKLSTAGAVIHSSNICTIKISQKLGAKGLERSLHDFGIGPDGSASEFPGASGGFVPSAADLPDEAYIGLVSHGISNRSELYITPLEMVQAYGAIANGGRLMKAIGLGGAQSPEVIREVLSSDVSEQMRRTLEGVVEEGTARSIKGSSLRLAGKTSTVVVDGNRRVTGFIGYAPANKPRAVIYVVMFDPKGKGKFGSSTAAPVFRDIAEKVVPVLQ
jgi:hypothetical protein